MRSEKHIMAFDLNTKCTGIWVTKETASGEILEIHTGSVIVDTFKVKDHFDFQESKKAIRTSQNGSIAHNAYVKKGETYVSKTEKAKRDREVRRVRNDYQLLEMSKQFSHLLKSVKPNFVILERNEMFRGIMTIEVLAKLNGMLMGECTNMGVPYIQLNVNAIREPYNVPRLVKEFAANHTPEFIASREDVAKAAIGWHLEHKYAAYGVKFNTDDESDAGLAYDYWKNHKQKGNK